MPERVVLDTNVLVSALLFDQGGPGQVLTACTFGSNVLFSSETWAELAHVLERPKFDRYVTTAERSEFLDRLAVYALPVNIVRRIMACRDPRDDKFLEVAVSGRADCIVTGDEDLLALHPFEGIPILTPQAFLSAYA